MAFLLVDASKRGQAPDLARAFSASETRRRWELADETELEMREHTERQLLPVYCKPPTDSVFDVDTFKTS